MSLGFVWEKLSYAWWPRFASAPSGKSEDNSWIRRLPLSSQIISSLLIVYLHISRCYIFQLPTFNFSPFNYAFQLLSIMQSIVSVRFYIPIQFCYIQTQKATKLFLHKEYYFICRNYTLKTYFKQATWDIFAFNAMKMRSRLPKSDLYFKFYRVCGRNVRDEGNSTRIWCRFCILEKQCDGESSL
jgi:hypothetical protein